MKISIVKEKRQQVILSLIGFVLMSLISCSPKMSTQVVSTNGSNEINFLHDFETAKSISAKNGKPIFMIFSGSDWCKPCIQLKETVIQTNTFIDFANKELVIIELDFPYKKQNQLSESQKKHNETIAADYNPGGQFPKMLLMDKNGVVLNEFVFDQLLSAEQLVAAIKKG